MTDNENITDIEIIKALEYIDDNVRWMLFECPVKWATSVSVIAFRARHLIYRLQAENERLQNCIDEQDIEISRLYKRIDETKAEAYKECIEKVKGEIAEALESNYQARAEKIDKHNVGDKTDFISYCGGKIDCLRGLDDFLNNLLKELVGDT